MNGLKALALVVAALGCGCATQNQITSLQRQILDLRMRTEASEQRAMDLEVDVRELKHAATDKPSPLSVCLTACANKKRSAPMDPDPQLDQACSGVPECENVEHTPSPSALDGRK